MIDYNTYKKYNNPKLCGETVYQLYVHSTYNTPYYMYNTHVESVSNCKPMTCFEIIYRFSLIKLRTIFC